jgi:hypothetical protein
MRFRASGLRVLLTPASVLRVVFPVLLPVPAVSPASKAPTCCKRDISSSIAATNCFISMRTLVPALQDISVEAAIYSDILEQVETALEFPTFMVKLLTPTTTCRSQSCRLECRLEMCQWITETLDTLPIGLVSLFPKERDARREAQRLGLLVKINTEAEIGRIRFDSLASFYLEVDFSADAVRPKSANTIPIVKHYVMDYLVPRWGNEIAEDIQALRYSKVASVPAQAKRACLDDGLEDPGHHAPGL